jgi:tripartite-type tricarboxylate transporter receptor subunit TctC
MIMRSWISALAFAGACAVSASAGASGGAYPAAPVTLIVPYSAGGGVDTIVRLVAPGLGKQLGQSVVVENRPGVSGVIGAQMVAHAKPDGYTLLAGNLTTGVINEFLMKSLGYDPAKDLQPVAELNAFPMVVVVPASSPLHSIQDVIAAAKKKPGGLVYGTAGIGSAQHLAASLFQHDTRTSMLHVPYKGASGVVTDLLGGRLDLDFEVAPVVMSQVEAGRLRALGVTSLQPLASLPKVAPIADQGVPGFEMMYWNAIFAPAGVPAQVLDRFNAALRKVLADPEVRSKMARMSMVPGNRYGNDFAAYVTAERAKWRALIREAGIKAE